MEKIAKVIAERVFEKLSVSPWLARRVLSEQIAPIIQGSVPDTVAAAAVRAIKKTHPRVTSLADMGTKSSPIAALQDVWAHRPMPGSKAMIREGRIPKSTSSGVEDSSFSALAKTIQ